MCYVHASMNADMSVALQPQQQKCGGLNVLCSNVSVLKDMHATEVDHRIVRCDPIPIIELMAAMCCARTLMDANMSLQSSKLCVVTNCPHCP